MSLVDPLPETVAPPVALASPPTRMDPPVVPGHDPAGVIAERVLNAGSVSLLVDADSSVLVVLHGAVDSDLAQEVRELVDDLVTNAAQTSGRPVRVLAEQVTRFELTGVWLLLELRRSARPERVTLVCPAAVVREAIELHGITGIDVED